MITREAAHKTLTARVGSIVSVDMERGFTRAWQQQGVNVAELLDVIEDLYGAVSSCEDVSLDLLNRVDKIINEYRSNV